MTLILAASLRSPFPDPKTVYALCFIFMAKLAKPHTAHSGGQLAVLWLHSICMLGRQAGGRCPMPESLCGISCGGCWLFVS